MFLTLPTSVLARQGSLIVSEKLCSLFSFPFISIKTNCFKNPTLNHAPISSPLDYPTFYIECDYLPRGRLVEENHETNFKLKTKSHKMSFYRIAVVKITSEKSWY